MKKKGSTLNTQKVSLFGSVLVYAVGIMNMIPLFIMVIGSIKHKFALIQYPMDLNPFKEPTLANIIKIIQETDLLLWFKNSFIISLSTTALTIIIGITAGYAFAKIKFRFKGLFFALVMATMMMPKQMMLVSNYLVADQLHLTNSLIGVVLTSLAPAFGVFLSRQFISSMPSELFDAAEIDGCSELRKFFSIVLPLSLPAAGTIGIFSFFGAFNDYIWQLIMISDPKLRTIPVGIGHYSSLNSSNYPLQLACALLSTIPLVVIFLCSQKLFIKGATAGAVKG